MARSLTSGSWNIYDGLIPLLENPRLDSWDSKLNPQSLLLHPQETKPTTPLFHIPNWKTPNNSKSKLDFATQLSKERGHMTGRPD